MSDNQTTSVPGLNELLGLLGTNPFAGLGRTFEQLRKGVGELVHTIENVNATMSELNRIAARVNNLIDTVEEPIQRVAPGLSTLADTLSSPALTAMPDELGRFVAVIGDVAAKIQPLGQLAEAAGGMFGLGKLGGLFGAGPSTVPPGATKVQAAVTPPAPPAPPAAPAPARTPASATAASAAKAAARPPAATRKPATKQPGAKKSAAKKPPSKRPAAKKPAAKQAPRKP